MLISMKMEESLLAATATAMPSFIAVKLPRTFWMLEPALPAHKHNALGPHVLTYLHPRGLRNAWFNCLWNATNFWRRLLSLQWWRQRHRVEFDSIIEFRRNWRVFPMKFSIALVWMANLAGGQTSTVPACGRTRVQIAGKACMIQDRIWIEAWDWNGPAARAFNLA